jgi:hypothetical protein
LQMEAFDIPTCHHHSQVMALAIETRFCNLESKSFCRLYLQQHDYSQYVTIVLLSCSNGSIIFL